ncbi:ABC multidrug transporter I, partial [Podosphaera aphanis]
MAILFRTLGCVCSDFDVAIKLATTVIILLVINSGYLIEYKSQKVWLRWIYYINPLGLGFSSLMLNEFGRINLECTSESLIPSGPGYKNFANQVCTLPGSLAGETKVSGSNYIISGFSYFPDQLWRNFGIIIVIALILLFFNLTLGELLTWGTAGNTSKIFQKPNKERDKLNEALLRKRDQNRMEKTNKASESEVKFLSKPILTWENLCYDVPMPTGTLRILNNIYGYVRPGTLTALMGASGAGKTTLLDVLAARKTIGVIGGDILVDGVNLGASFQRAAGYAEQMDIHEQTQTVREALRFSADLRQPFDVPRHEKYAYVEEIIGLLEMEYIADAIIGDSTAGLSVEQQKRVTIGVELAAKPELLLFLDEPTSGLDSQSAFNIIRFLRKLSDAGQAILCTIHQPNAALFERFDRLLLLQHGGKTVYFGDIGDDAVILRNYFQQHGAICPPDVNVAEWMLEAIGTGQTVGVGSKDWGDIWIESTELVKIKESIAQIKRQRIEEAQRKATTDEKEFATPFYHQLKIVQARTNRSFWRSSNYGFTRLFNHFILALITGLVYLNLDNSLASLQYRIFIIFQAVLLPAFILPQVQIKYAISRMIYYREASAKMYSSLVFAISMVIAETPYSILCAVAFFLPFYYMPGFHYASSRVGYQFLMVLIAELFAVTLGQLIAAVTPSPVISSLLIPFIMITFALFCGVTIPKPLIPIYWRAWLTEINPLTRMTGGMIVTELNGLP